MKDLFKIIVIGEKNVGKTSIINRYCEGTFQSVYKATIGTDLLTKNYECDGKSYAIQIWDTAGTERYRSVVKSFYRGSDACLLVYDQTDQSTFDALDSWLSEFRSTLSASEIESLPIYLAGNKCDDQPNVIVSQDIVKKWCSINNIVNSYSVSAKDDINIITLFDEMCQKIISNLDVSPQPEFQIKLTQEVNRQTVAISPMSPTPDQPKKCCS